MKKIEMLKNKIKSVRENAGEEGFSLLELVVAVGILLVLTVGGLLAYSGITNNARTAAAQSAASEIYTAATAKEAAGETNAGAQEAAEEWLGAAQDGKFEVSYDEGTNSIKVKTVAGGDVAMKGSLQVENSEDWTLANA